MSIRFALLYRSGVDEFLPDAGIHRKTLFHYSETNAEINILRKCYPSEPHDNVTTNVALYQYTSETMTSLSTRIIAVAPEAIALAGDGNAALLLTQILFWWRVAGRKRFYKFNSPCEHDLYRAGDSWMEELCLKRTMLCTARQRVAVRVRYIHHQEVIQAAFDEGALVVYGTDRNRLTWYHVNEKALQERAPALYARLIGGGGTEPAFPSRTDKPKTYPQQAVSPQVAPPPPIAAPANTDFSQSSDTELPNVQPLHWGMQGSDIGLHTEKASKTAPENSLKNTPLIAVPLPTPTSAKGEGGADRAAQSKIAKSVFDELQARGVQRDPARLIAIRCAKSGWSVEKTLEMFDAHLLDAERAGVRSPVGVVVSRMLDGNGTTITPAPTWALERVRKHALERTRTMQRERDIAARVMVGAEQEVEVAEENAGGEAEVMPVSATKDLWRRVLGDLRLQVTRATFEQRLQRTWLEEKEGEYIVRSSDCHTIEWLQNRLHRLINASLQRWSGGEKVHLQFEVLRK